MRAEAKLKVSLTLSADVVALVDRDAKLRKGTRSAVVEQWLRRAASAAVEKEIEDKTAAYYGSLRDEERAEDVAIARALSSTARRISYDEPRRPRRAAR